ncbi:MAG: flippase-like domain-containing protein [Bacteroidales bacterium]|nr:flippase-like domain-containing protein [Bacteroidales bacterium]
MDRIKKILQWLLPLVLGIFLFWLVFRKMDFEAMKAIFAEGLRWEWIGVYVLLFLLPMIIRGLRWQQLLDEVTPGVRVGNTILSVFVAYGANLLFPRIGEVARCALLKQYDGSSFSKSLGTVVTERVFDIICLALMALAAILLQLDVFRQFFVENPSSAEKIVAILTSWKLWLAVLLFVFLAIFAFKYLKTKTVYKKVQQTLKQLWEGMLSVRHLKHPCLFIFYTIAIWVFYFLSFYVGKYFFHVPLELSMLAMFTAHIMGSFGIVAPVQGGIGAWHFMVIFTMGCYGISSVQAGTFALTVHGLNTLLTILFGALAYFLICLRTKKTAKA